VVKLAKSNSQSGKPHDYSKAGNWEELNFLFHQDDFYFIVFREVLLTAVG
jgi:hypothetical protein